MWLARVTAPVLPFLGSGVGMRAEFTQISRFWAYSIHAKRLETAHVTRVFLRPMGRQRYIPSVTRAGDRGLSGFNPGGFVHSRPNERRARDLEFPVLMRILGIETSCDETAAAVIDGWTVLSNVLHTQEVHSEFGGVVPEIASREHLRLLPGIVREALARAGTQVADLDGIAFTRGPGLAGPLLVGAAFARALAMESGKPLWGGNHLEGHLAAVRLSHPELRPPFLCLTVSGGHTELTEVLPDGSFLALGATRDDAAGEAFDKCGKILGLGYPAGPAVSREAAKGNRKAFPFPVGLRHEGLDFSFSGLKTAVSRAVQDAPDVASARADLCAGLQEAIVDALVLKAVKALSERNLPGVAVCGGVSANARLRERMQAACAKTGAWCRFPEPALCTDNGAMIAGAVQWRLERGASAELVPDVDPGLSLG